MLNACLIHECRTLFDGVEQLKPVVVRKQYHARMRKKSENNHFTANFVSQLFQPVDDDFMSFVNTVKSAKRDDSVVNLLEKVNMIVNFQK